MACCHLYKKEEKKRKKKEEFFFDIVCDKYTDAFKLGAN
jgi:putative aminopeptidase FrvX